MKASKQTYTHRCNEVTLVWGSLMLAPIIAHVYLHGNVPEWLAFMRLAKNILSKLSKISIACSYHIFNARNSLSWDSNKPFYTL